MFEVRKVQTNEVLATFISEEEAKAFVISNWNQGPMEIRSTLSESVVSKPQMLME